MIFMIQHVIYFYIIITFYFYLIKSFPLCFASVSFSFFEMISPDLEKTLSQLTDEAGVAEEATASLYKLG